MLAHEVLVGVTGARSLGTIALAAGLFDEANCFFAIVISAVAGHAHVTNDLGVGFNYVHEKSF